MTLIKNQERIKEDKERVRVRKSRYVESDKTYCYTEKFNITLSIVVTTHQNGTHNLLTSAKL